MIPAGYRRAGTSNKRTRVMTPRQATAATNLTTTKTNTANSDSDTSNKLASASATTVVPAGTPCPPHRGAAMPSSLSPPPPRLSLSGGAVAPVDEVVVLAARHGEQRHALLLVVEHRQVRCHRRGMSLLPLPQFLSYFLIQFVMATMAASCARRQEDAIPTSVWKISNRKIWYVQKPMYIR